MDALIASLSALGPLMLLSFLLIPRAWADRNPLSIRKLVGRVTWVAFGAAVLATGGLVVNGPVDHRFLGLGPTAGLNLTLGVYFDALSATMLLLVSLLGAIVSRYARHYLDGDSRQGHFMKWMAVTVGSVLTLIVSGNLVLFALGWMATSLSLHKLLVFYSDRRGALLAARKKFIISRLGDACLIGAMVLIYSCFGSLEFGKIFAATNALHAGAVEGLLASNDGRFVWISILLALCALLKSAQFPFHSWLPEVMETPTPVSALLHAGIINAGGFLIVRMSHVVSLSPLVLDGLAIAGAFTALFASVVMLTQTSIKVSLAYSTVAQMGFMMLQCGLGAFSAATVHIVAHSMYKAHAFLSSGSIIDISKSSWVPAKRPKRHPFQFVAALVLSVILTLAMALAFGVSPATEPGVVVLAAVLVMAVTHLIWSSIGDQYTVPVAIRGLAMATLVCLAFFTLQIGSSHLLASALPQAVAMRTDFDLWLTGSVIALFMAVLVFQTQLPHRGQDPLWQRAYVHIYNGLYLGSFASRLVDRVWPIEAKDTV